MACFERDYWELEDAEELHRQHPGTFEIPPLNWRQSLKHGDAAKLIFLIELEQEDGKIIVQGERIFVIVSERVGDAYVGILDGQPVSLERSDSIYLRFGAEVPFRPEHVIDIAKPPAEYVEWQLGIPPERRWPREG